MKLKLDSVRQGAGWVGYHLPAYDIEAAAAATMERPRWMHFGTGNIFRIFPAVLCQRLLEAGLMDTGIVCCDRRDEAFDLCMRPHDNLTVGVTLNSDGTICKEVIGSMVCTLTLQSDRERIAELFKKPSLQMVSFTITEKGYSLRNADNELMPDVLRDMEGGPGAARSFMGLIAAMCLGRKAACGAPLALVSMDNCSKNGDLLKSSVLEFAAAWLRGGSISEEEYNYLSEDIAYPLSMIDKITPRPHPMVEQTLKDDGLEDISPVVTSRHTYVAPFVNAEKPQYLVIEDCFPNGRPPLENAGVIFTDRDTVNKVERMKVSTCLNPLHTCLAVYGCLLGYDSIAAEMKDPELSTFIDRMSHEEGMPFVVNPGVIDPGAFLDEVLTERFPNHFIPDTPQRIATDTSQKLSVRFGETIKAYVNSPDHEASELKFIPLVLAGWLRYLVGIDDKGMEFEPSQDPLLGALKEQLGDMRPGAVGPGSDSCDVPGKAAGAASEKEATGTEGDADAVGISGDADAVGAAGAREAAIGTAGAVDVAGEEGSAAGVQVQDAWLYEERLGPILRDKEIFGVDLYECGLAARVLGYFAEMMTGPGAVRRTLRKYLQKD